VRLQEQLRNVGILRMADRLQFVVGAVECGEKYELVGARNRAGAGGVGYGAYLLLRGIQNALLQARV
jgi:hypothetical protein